MKKLRAVIQRDPIDRGMRMKPSFDFLLAHAVPLGAQPRNDIDDSGHELRAKPLAKLLQAGATAPVGTDDHQHIWMRHKPAFQKWQLAEGARRVPMKHTIKVQKKDFFVWVNCPLNRGRCRSRVRNERPAKA